MKIAILDDCFDTLRTLPSFGKLAGHDVTVEGGAVRRQLVAPGAREDALQAGRPGQAAVDVFENEPVKDPDHPLFRHASSVFTPRIGYVTKDEYEVQFSDVFEIVAYARGAPITIVNPAALAKR